jgi:protein gp37
MAANSRIEWTDHTFNPWWGCTKVSPGCAHCYAEALDHRLYDRTGRGHWGSGRARMPASESVWSQPVQWNRKAAQAQRRDRVFCASMADVFDDEVPPAWRARLWQLIRDTPALDWQLLTKRPQNIRRFLPANWGDDGWPNVWLGTTVEDQQRADERVPRLLEVPARVRFLSCEPLLGEVDLSAWLPVMHGEVCGWGFHPLAHAKILDGGGVDIDIHWVIAGGESGRGARPMHPQWARSLRDQCAASGVGFFFKQWGEWQPIDQPWRQESPQPLGLRERWMNDEGGEGFHGHDVFRMRRVGKYVAGRKLDDCSHDGGPRGIT